MNERRVTLADVAREAKVHPTTVSMALRNHPRLPSQTREKIQQIAEAMGYRPDPFVQALVAYRRRVSEPKNPPTIAYVTNWSTRLGWKHVTAHPEFHEGAVRKAQKLGFKVEHFWMREPGVSHARLSRILETRGISGIIIASHMREMDTALHFDWARFSAVKIDYFPHEPRLHNVTNYHCGIVRLAMQRVMSMGYRRIGFVMHRGWDHSVDNLWRAGFLCEQTRVAAAQAIPPFIFPGEHPVEAWMNEGKSDVVAPLDEFQKWYRQHRPEVIISKRSFIEPCLQAMGLKTPGDVAFVDTFLEKPDGSVAGVMQNHLRVGELAAEILIGQLQQNNFGIPEVPTTTFVDGTWHDGTTCPSLVAPAATVVPSEAVAVGR